MRPGIEHLLRTVEAPDPTRVEALWAEYCAGGPGADGAFTTLVAWYGGAIYRRIWGFLRSDAADDVFQDVLARLHRERSRLTTFADALRWLRTVALRSCVDAHRRAARRKTRERMRAVPAEAAALPEVLSDDSEALRAALAKLSERERQAVALVFFEGRTRQDAAAEIGVHRDTFAKTLDGALARLRSALSTVVVAASATTAALEAALVARPPLATPLRLADLAVVALNNAGRAGAISAGWWLIEKKLVLVGLVVGGLLLVSVITRIASMPVAPKARLGVTQLEPRDNPSGGLLDTTFGTNGMATFSTATGNSTDTPIAVQPDGGIVALNTVSRGPGRMQAVVSRLNANGSVDTTFGTGGAVNLPVALTSYGTGLAVQRDGKILVTGYAFTKTGGSGYSDSEYAVARLNSNGTLDTTFGGAGTGWWIHNPTAGDESATTLSVVPSGSSWSIYVGSQTKSTSVGVVKLTAAGRLDTAYGTGGIASRAIGVSTSWKTIPLAVTPSGRAVVASGSVYAFTVAGQVDTGFGSNGAATNTFVGGVQAIAAQGESLVAVGYWGNTPGPTGSPTGVAMGVITRYTPIGTVDPTFGTAGELRGPSVGGTTFTASQFSGVTVASDGSITAVGIIAKKNAAGVVTKGVLLARLTAAGQPDATFGPAPDGSGTVARFDVDPNLTAYSNGARPGLVLDASGNILLGAAVSNPATSNTRVVLRFTGS